MGQATSPLPAANLSSYRIIMHLIRNNSLLCILLATLTHGVPKPQQEPDPDLVKDIFGLEGDATRSGTNGYSGNSAPADTNVDLLVQIVQESSSEKFSAPDDYSENQITNAKIEEDNQFENCADYTEKFGYECVPYYQCSNGSIITDGAGLIDIRNGFGALNAEDGKCPGFLDVCCKDPDFVPPPPPVKQYKTKCGQRHQNGLGARIQGFKENESQMGEWPHMCAVLKETRIGDSDPVNVYQCGGSLISPGVVLTAAHCVDKSRDDVSGLKVRCGEWDTQTTNEPYPHQDRSVKALRLHPEYEGRNLFNDFAVLFLESNFDLDINLDSVCLPEPEETFDGTTCFATGWGKDKFGSAGEYQVVLKEIDLPVVSNDVCQDSLRTTRLGKRFKLHPSFICAGGIPGKDTCKGDGGSPLVCPSKYDPNTYVQAGIVAWGIGCGETGTPGVYAGVSKAVCWIDQAMTCYYGGQTGDYNSFWGYSDDVCGVSIRESIQKVEESRRPPSLKSILVKQYQECTVNYKAEGSNGNLVDGEEDYDFSAFERVGKPKVPSGNQEE